jgi:hypothetical protein
MPTSLHIVVYFANEGEVHDVASDQLVYLRKHVHTQYRCHQEALQQGIELQ